MPVVTMPQLGESVSEGTILKWLKQPGEPVKLDDPLCEIETEKVTAELPSQFEGTMGAQLVPEGATVEIGVPLCEVLGAGEQPGVSSRAESAPTAAVPRAEPATPPASQNGGWQGGPMAIPEGEEPSAARPRPSAPAPAPASAPQAPAPVSAPGSMASYFSPVVARLAAEHGLDLKAIRGTGAGGRVTKQDVERAIAGAPPRVSAPPLVSTPSATSVPSAARSTRTPPGSYDSIQLSATRRTIAANLVRSNTEAPQAWTMVEADYTALIARREREKARLAADGVELTLLPLFVEAVCTALKQVPVLNARWEGDELRRYHAINAGIAVAAETGLVVPVLKDAGLLALDGLARGLADLVERARSRRLRIEDIEDGTITINNTGAFGSISSKPIVNPPQVAIVTMERVVRRPVAVGDAIAIRPIGNVCLSFDHRALDGLEAGQFLAALKGAIEAGD